MNHGQSEIDAVAAAAAAAAVMMPMPLLMPHMILKMVVIMILAIG